MRRAFAGLITAFAILALQACGTLTGAAVGGAVGHTQGETAKGAAIGAGVGAVYDITH